MKMMLEPVAKIEGMPDGGRQETGRLVALFRSLADETRLSLLMLLAGGERNVTELCEALRQPQPTVSHHLGLLRMAGLVAGRRAGKQIYYGLAGRAAAKPGALAFDEGVTIRLGAADGAVQ